MKSYSSNKIPNEGEDFQKLNETDILEGNDANTKIEKLIAELDRENGVIDEFELRRIEEVIDVIKSTGDLEIEYDEKSSYENFKNLLMPKAIEQMDNLDKLKTDAEQKLAKYNRKSAPKYRFTRAAIYAASFVFLITTFNLASIVFADINWFKPLLEWGADAFSVNTKSRINNPSDLGDGRKLFTDYKYVEQHYSTAILKPTFTPKGFNLEDLLVFENEDESIFTIRARYVSEETTYSISIGKADNMGSDINTYSKSIEKTIVVVQELESNGIVFFIFENEGWPAAFWSYRDFSYSLYGTLELGDLEKILSSIQTK